MEEESPPKGPMHSSRAPMTTPADCGAHFGRVECLTGSTRAACNSHRLASAVIGSKRHPGTSRDYSTGTILLSASMYVLYLHVVYVRMYVYMYVCRGDAG